MTFKVLSYNIREGGATNARADVTITSVDGRPLGRLSGVTLAPGRAGSPETGPSFASFVDALRSQGGQ